MLFNFNLDVWVVFFNHQPNILIYDVRQLIGSDDFILRSVVCPTLHFKHLAKPPIKLTECYRYLRVKYFIPFNVWQRN